MRHKKPAGHSLCKNIKEALISPGGNKRWMCFYSEKFEHATFRRFKGKSYDIEPNAKVYYSS